MALPFGLTGLAQASCPSSRPWSRCRPGATFVARGEGPEGGQVVGCGSSSGQTNTFGLGPTVSSSGEKTRQPLECRLEDRSFCGIGDPYGALTAGAKGRTRRNTDFLLDQEPTTEVERVLEPTEPREEIESPVGLWNGNSGHLTKSRQTEIAFLLQRSDHAPERVFTLDQGGLGRHLGERCRVRNK